MIILGIDPGTATTGYGVLHKDGQKITALDYGVMLTPASDDPPARLLSIYHQATAILDRYNPDMIATERLFFGRNETTAFSVGRAVGVILLLAAQRELPWMEYTPMQVKQAVVGYGGADKKQVQYMIERLLNLPGPPKTDDAADALAIAICHAHSLPVLAARYSK